MHAYPSDETYNKLTADIIGGAIEVHREFGPGLMESIYEKTLMHELHLRGHKTRIQSRVPITYKGYTFEEELRTDIIVDDLVIVENKAVETILPVHKAQLLSYS
ncbi:MAG: GxxExxY protein [Puniceicoccales bacterium]|jgi:GxxExxY protein|nr:GxxExxY protein [Puniceicoccales bacterium]